jgi:cysteine synthase A
MTVAHTTLDTIGNTPVVQLNGLAGDAAARVLVKLESFNPTGSYKDRMARTIIEGAEARGDLRPGSTVVELTGGSTGSSLAFVCAIKGYPLKIVTSDAFAPEKLRTMRAFGAELVIEPSVDGQITPDLIPRMIARAEAIERDEGAYRTDQFHNADALTGYRAIADELAAQVDGPIDAFVGGVGTAGMIVGVGRGLREHHPHVRVIGLEPASAPLLSTGTPGTHHIEGVGVGIVPPLLGDGDLDAVWAIDEAEARETARRLAREAGILAGTSSGMNVAGALRLARELGPGHTVVTVAVDTGLKYLAGDLFAT